MHFLTVAAGVTLTLLQVTSDVAAGLSPPIDAMAVNANATHQATMPGPDVLQSGPPGLPAGSSPDSEETPDPLVEAAHVPPASSDNMTSSPDKPKAMPGSHPPEGAEVVPPGYPSTLVPGEMVGGKCMCPPPPSCAVPILPPSPTAHDPDIVPPPGNVTDPTSKGSLPAPPPPAPTGDLENNGTTSAGSSVVEPGSSLTSLLTLAFVAIVL